MECPRCKEDMPLLSKICPVCGYVIEHSRNTEIESLIREIETDLAEIKSLPYPTFAKSMATLSYILFPIIAIIFLILALITSAGLFWIVFLLFLLFSIVTIVKKSKGVLGNARFDSSFNLLKNRFEQRERSARQSYGKNREVSQLLDEISNKITEIEQSRKSMSRKNIIVWSIIVVLLIGLSAQGVSMISNAVQSASTDNKSNLEMSIELFKKNVKLNDEITQTHSAILLEILKNDKQAEAIELFRLYCEGKMGDFDCAVIIVNYLNDNGAKEAADKFINECNNLRYKSDKTKLLNLATIKK